MRPEFRLRIAVAMCGHGLLLPDDGLQRWRCVLSRRLNRGAKLIEFRGLILRALFILGL